MEEIIIKEISCERFDENTANNRSDFSEENEKRFAGTERQEPKNEYHNGGKNMDKKLTKSQSNRMLCGVCAGIAEYFNMDPTVIRLLWVILTFFGGSGILAYIIAAVIIPES